jgi:hypothetical protein
MEPSIGGTSTTGQAGNTHREARQSTDAHPATSLLDRIDAAVRKKPAQLGVHTLQAQATPADGPLLRKDASVAEPQLNDAGEGPAAPAGAGSATTPDAPVTVRLKLLPITSASTAGNAIAELQDQSSPLPGSRDEIPRPRLLSNDAASVREAGSRMAVPDVEDDSNMQMEASSDDVDNSSILLIHNGNGSGDAPEHVVPGLSGPLLRGHRLDDCYSSARTAHPTSEVEAEAATTLRGLPPLPAFIRDSGLASHVQVAARIRPQTALELLEGGVYCLDVASAASDGGDEAHLAASQAAVTVRATAAMQRDATYRLHAVLGPEVSQSEVYDCVAHPIICSVLYGYNGGCHGPPPPRVGGLQRAAHR